MQAARGRTLSRMSWLLGLPAKIYFIIDGPFPPRARRTAWGAFNIGAVVHRMVEDYGFQWTEVCTTFVHLGRTDSE